VDSFFTDVGPDVDPNVHDTIVTDVDGNGSADVVQFDSDHDGFYDTTVDVSTGTVIVTDDHGVVQTVDYGETLPDTAPPADPAPPSDGPPADPAPPSDGPPADPAPPDMHGNPDADSYLWFDQEKDGLCVPASVSEVVAEFRGVPDAGSLLPEVTSAAEGFGLIETGDGYSGMTMDNAGALLDSLGVPNHIEHGDIGTLEQMLDQNRSIIVSVDADELPLWGETDPGDGTGADQGADHALVVTGIDEEKGLVYLNDPGHPEGREETLTIDQFKDAWADGDNTMVVTDSAPSDAAPPAPGEQIGGAVLLPITVPGSLLVPAVS
jgi:hypothetical protein